MKGNQDGRDNCNLTFIAALYIIPTARNQINFHQSPEDKVNIHTQMQFSLSKAGTFVTEPGRY